MMRIICFALTVFGLMGCGADRDDPLELSCPGPDESPNASIVAMDVQILSSDDVEEPTDVSVLLNWISEPKTEVTQVPVEKGFLPTFSLFSQAHALSCVAHPFDERISVINITSDQDYNNMLPAGSRLNEIFVPPGVDEPLESILQRTNLYPGGGEFLIFYQAPDTDLDHRFTIEIVLDNDQILTATTEPFSF